MVRFLHAADLHLGLRITRFEESACNRIGEARFEAVEQLRVKAAEHKADFVVIAGDIFDDHSVSKSVAERAAVNAHEAGLAVQTLGENFAVRGAEHADAALLRIPLGSIDPAVALTHIAARLPVTTPDQKLLRTPEQLLRAERALLADYSVIPIAHVPEIYGVSTRIHNWSVPGAGGWEFSGTWLEAPSSAAAVSGRHP